MITNPITKIFKSKPSKYDEDDGEWWMIEYYLEIRRI